MSMLQIYTCATLADVGRMFIILTNWIVVNVNGVVWGYGGVNDTVQMIGVVQC